MIGMTGSESAGPSINEIFRQYGGSYEQAYGMSGEQRRVLRDIIDCRSGALGGHIEQCDSCNEVHFRHHSCRNRHCPQCGGLARSEWLVTRGAELLPVPYYHVVFTLDHVFNALLRLNQQVCYDLFYKVVNEQLKAYGERYLGGEIGFIAVLHTWGQQLTYHVHLHCIVMGGALKPDGEFVTSRGDWLFPVEALSADFRDAYCAGLVKLHEAGQLQFGWGCETASVFAQQLVTSLAQDWEVYIKPPFGRPETVLEYLAGYVNRIAISNNRIEGLVDDKVTFRYRDYRDEGKPKSLTLPVHEFMRRFFQHVLPAGFVRIRYYGLWHANCRGKLARCRQQVVQAQPGLDTALLTLWFRPLTDEEKTRCPACGEGQLVRIGEYEGTRQQLPHRQRRRPRLRAEVRRGQALAA